MKALANILEVAMLLCFGASWPINCQKALRAGTAKGSSLSFFILIEVGYAAGVAAKILNQSINYVLIFYLINMLAVAANITVYFINRKKDIARSIPCTESRYG